MLREKNIFSWLDNDSKESLISSFDLIKFVKTLKKIFFSCNKKFFTLEMKVNRDDKKFPVLKTQLGDLQCKFSITGKTSHKHPLELRVSNSSARKLLNLLISIQWTFYKNYFETFSH